MQTPSKKTKVERASVCVFREQSGESARKGVHRQEEANPAGTEVLEKRYGKELSCR